MKTHQKNFILAVLFLLVSLLLCACDAELTAEQLSPLYGEWITETSFYPHEDQEEIPFLITFNENGTCQVDDSSSLTWTAKAVKESANLEVSIKEDKNTLYTFHLNVSEDFTDGTLYDKKKERYYSTYFQKDTEIDLSQEGLIYTEWFPRGYAGNTTPFILEKDGTCQMDGQKYQWVVQPSRYTEENLQILSVYDETTTKYIAEIRQNRAGIPDLSMFTCSVNQQDWLDSYYPHPLMKETYYYAFNHENPLAYDININSEFIHMDSTEYSMELSENTTADTLIYYVPNAQDPAYEFTITNDGGFPNLTIKDLSSEEIYYYYNPEQGHRPDHPDFLYNQALTALTCYAEDDSLHISEEEGWLSERDLLHYAYENFSQIDGYRDSSDYLSRFIIVEDQLLSTDYHRTDNLGNEDTDSEHTVYTYDSKGRLASFYDNDYAISYGLSARGMSYFSRVYLIYDTNDRIHEIQLRSYDTLEAQCYPVYDETGNIIRMHIFKNSEETVSSFSYDEEGRLVKITMEDGTLLHQYTDDGLLSLSYLLTNDRRIRTEYTYENTALVQKLKRYEGYYDEPWYVTDTYHYDADGKLLRTERTSTQTDYDYRSEEFVFIYDDIYYYNELPEEAESSEPFSSDFSYHLEDGTTARIIGEWNVYPSEEDFQVSNLIFNEDGTCSMDGETFTYELKDKSETRLSVYLLRDQIPAAYFYSNLNSSNVNHGSLCLIQEDGTEITSSPAYYRVEDYNIYEITADNFFDYFELTEEISVDEDSFGDITYAHVKHRYLMKEEYGTVYTSLSDVVLEYTYDQVHQMCTFDPDTKSYQLGTVINPDCYNGTETLRLGTVYIDDIPYYGFSYYYFSTDQFPEDEVFPIENLEITRLRGTIYTIVQ